jgi:hypothetical protein
MRIVAGTIPGPCHLRQALQRSKVWRRDTPEFEILGLCWSTDSVCFRQESHRNLPVEGAELSPDKGGRLSNEDAAAPPVA